MARGVGAVITAAKAVWEALCAFGHLLGIFLHTKERFKHGQRFQAYMDGDSFDVVIAAFENNPSGRALMEARPDTVRILADRADLARRPTGSFARCYLDFLQANDLDDAAYAEAAKEDLAPFAMDPKLMWVRARVGSGHDVRHVITGYGSDQLGEACLLALRVGQTGHRGAAILAGVVSFICIFIHGPVSTYKAITEAHQRGRSALLVDLCPFEFDLSESLESCRAKLGLTPARAYQALLDRKGRGKLQKPSPAQPVGPEPSV
jgi:ubiquinone biosynthesis protein COQ4